MCDIYNHPCKICGKPIDMHLGDYATNSSEIEVFCTHHIPSKNVSIWNCKDAWYSIIRQEYFICGNPMRFGIRYLTDNAIKHKDWNHPNFAYCEIIEER